MLPFLTLKTTFDKVSRALNINQEPSGDILVLANYFQNLALDDGAILDKVLDEEPPLEEQDKPFLTKAHLKYILEDCACKLVQKVHRERSTNQMFLGAIATLLQSIMLFAIPVMKRKIFNIDFLLGLRAALEGEHFFHKCHYQIPDSEIQKLFTKGSGQTWRTDLKVGDCVDCLLHYYDQREVSRGAGWSQAKVHAIQGDNIQLKFLLEPRSSDRIIDRWSNEMAPFESETKEIWEYKASLKVDDLIDAQDDTHNWRPSTVIGIFTTEDDGKEIPMVRVGLRVYMENGPRTDARGAYDGFGEKFDEHIPLYSPKITHYKSMSSKDKADMDGELDETLDEVIEPINGASRPWGVPRPRKCTSQAFLNNLSVFCEAGGLDVMLKSIEEGEFSDKENEFNITVLACLFSGASYPAIIYHKKVIEDYGQRFVDLSKMKLLQAPDKALRDMRREAIDAIMKAVEAFNKRLLKKGERKKNVETLKLNVCLMCLKSEFLQRRIQGITDLTQIIKNQRISISSMTGKAIIEWMKANEVLELIFDPVRTHEQVVQRCDEIIKVLLAENELTDDRLKLFWGLTKSDYRLDTYKIIADCSYSFKQDHLEFFFEQMCSGIPVEKLDMDDFNCISELGKFQTNKESNFMNKVTQFFWKIATAAAGYPNEKASSLEVIDHCSKKYREMVKYNVSLEKKREMILELGKLIKSSDIGSSVACLNLLSGIIKDQADKFTSYTTSGSTGYTSGWNNNGTYGGTSNTTALRSKANNLANQDKEEEKQIEEAKELTLQAILEEVISEHDIISVVLDNLKAYCESANAYVQKEKDVPDRKKLFVNYGTYSHQDEIDKRLEFLKFFAEQNSNYAISQKELGVIYDLLVTKSQVPSDQQEFLSWCKSSCESGTGSKTVMDFKEVGQFFTDKINNNELNLADLSPTGYEFLQTYFLSANESAQKIERVKPKSYTSGTGYNYNKGYSGYGTNDYKSSYSMTGGTGYTWQNNNNNYNNNSTTTTNTDSNKILVKVHPTELTEMDLLWRLVLETQNPDVVSKVVTFFISLHTNLEDDIADKKTEILNILIKEIMDRLKTNKVTTQQVRLVEILKGLINESEATGASTIVPHGSLEMGETCEVTVKDDAGIQGVTMMPCEARIQVCTNTTLWELKEEYARMMDFSAKYLKFGIGKNYTNRTWYTDRDNCKTMKELGVTGGEWFISQKSLPENTAVAITLADQDGFTPLAKRVFDMLFDMYAERDGTWSKMSCGNFIQGCVGERSSGPDDSRVKDVFDQWDKDQDGKLQREEFFGFYMKAARERPQTVRENLKNFNIRQDLRKWSEIGEAATAKKEEMPRYFLSTAQEHFDSLMSLLDNSADEVATEVWQLIQMLQTNHHFYKSVLTLDLAKDDQKVNWARFFDRSHPYQLLYTLQIVQAVINEGDSGSSKRAVCLNPDEIFTANLLRFKYPAYEEIAKLQEGNDLTIKDDEEEDKEMEQTQQPLQRKKSSVVGSAEEEANLRASWAKQFVINGGFEFIMNDLLACNLSVNNAKGNEKEVNELKYLTFILDVFETFLSAAVSNTDQAKAAQIEALRNQRASGKDTNKEEEKDDDLDDEDEEVDRFKQLQAALKGDLSVKIVNLINYEALQTRIIEIVSHTLGKDMVYEDKAIVENALQLWVGCLQQDPALFIKFSESPQAVEFVMRGILECDHESIREQFKIILTNLFTVGENTLALEFILTILFKNLDKLTGTSDQYIALFCNALENFALRISTNPELAKVLDSDAVLSAVIARITKENQQAAELRNNAKETSQNTEQILAISSKFLLNLMGLAGKILESFDTSKEDQTASELIVALNSGSTDQSQLQKQGLMMEIFTKFMFPMVFSEGKRGEFNMLKVIEQKINARTAGKQAKNAQSAQANIAYKVLVGLVKSDITLMSFFMNKCLTPVVENIQRAETWQYAPPNQGQGSGSRSQEFVGLRNPACVCYMNSMTQQLFMIPPFRYNLLAADDKLMENYQNYKGEMIDDNVLHQWQHIMANLELGQTHDYLAKGFHFALKDFDGQPTNVIEQKDAQEFIGILMDRLEEGLKKTKRKHLIRSIFGYKSCSQLICPECGKVKNRLEDQLTMSLTVKDLKSIQHSWEKMIEGEKIADFTCSGCTKKVDILKRTLLAETPSVLIVHLQRILFDFNTFQNEKMNQYYEFPQELDLKPFSYHEVMKKEGRIKEEEEKNGDEEDGQLAKGEPAEAGEEEEENPVPEQEDCYEYSLAGVTIHSGSANSGHYWAYACGERDGLRRNDGNPVDHKEAKWYEFNDSRVSDWDISKLKSEAFGGDKSSSNFGISSMDSWGGSSFGGGGNSYGQSGYLLVYERKVKKPIKMTRWVDSTEPVEEGKEPEKVEENYFVDYHQSVESDDKPNKIFHQVLDQNAKFGFEKEIYQPEFFEFVLTVQKAVASIDSDDPTIQNLRRKAIEIANKGTLEIYASAAQCPQVDEAFRVLGQLFAKDKTFTLHKEFLQYWWTSDKFSYLYQLLLENPDLAARQAFGKFMRYIIVAVRELEKDYLSEPEDYVVQGDNGVTITMQRAKALSARFILHGMDMFNTKVAKFWQRFEQFLEMLYFFGVSDLKSAEDVILKPPGEGPRAADLDPTSEAAKVGLGFYAKQSFLLKACDFMLGNKSPLCPATERRPELGNYSNNADLTHLVNLVTIMIDDKDVQEANPLSDQEKNMLLHPHLLKNVLSSSSADSFANLLADMCKENYRLSKKVSKVFLNAISNANSDSISNYMATLKPFLTIEDNLKALRLEWVFGVADHRSQKPTSSLDRPQYGIEMVQTINDDHMIYECPILYPKPQECLVQQILQLKGRIDSQCVTCLKDLTALMRHDPNITQYLFNLLPSHYADARFTDWFKPYLVEQIAEINRFNNSYQRQRLEVTKEALANVEALQPQFDELLAGQMDRMKKALETKSEYSDIAEKWLAVSNPTGEIIPHFPPGVVIGKLTSDEVEYFRDDSNEFLSLVMYAVEGEWCYSAPTGAFNLAVPDKKRKTSSHYMNESYQEYRKKVHISNGGSTTDQIDLGIDQEYWNNNKQVGPILLRVKLDFKTNDKDLKIWYKIGTKSGNTDGINVILPISKRKNHLSGGHRRLCESLRVLDPSKGYLFADPNDIKVDLEVTVTQDNSLYTRGTNIGIGTGNTTSLRTGGAKTVTYATADVSYPAQADDPDPYDDLYGDGDGQRDDNAAYNAWQNNESGNQGQAEFSIQHAGNDPQNAEIAAMLDLGVDQLEPNTQDVEFYAGQGDNKSGNSSTNAVGDFDVNDGDQFEG